MEDYEIISRIGGGSFADVYKAKEKSTGDIVAIKVLKKKYNNWSECLELREVKSLQKLHEEHLNNQKGIENIVKLKRIVFINESGTLNLIFEFLDRDLFELMKSKAPKGLTENQIRTIAYQTLLGLSFMHKYGFFHRDMKPENLLVVGDTVKIADFGLAREIRSIPPYTEYVSTRYYRAPECILKSTNYNSPVDIWALGCIIAEMYLHPQPLFFGNNEKEVLFRMCSILGTPTHATWTEGMQQAKKVDIKFPSCPGVNLAEVIPQASPEAIDLMYQMINWDPSKRNTAYNLLQHPFFTKYPLYNKISDVDYSDTINSQSKKGVKRYTNNKAKININVDTSTNSNMKASIASISKDDESISKILNDTEGFDKLINQLKNEKIEVDKEIENKNVLFSREFDLNEIDSTKQLNIENSPTNSNSNPLFKNPTFDFPKKNFPPQSKPILSNNLDTFLTKNTKNIEIDNANNPKPKEIDFDTKILLKKNITNNNRQRSALRFIQETNQDNYLSAPLNSNLKPSGITNNNSIFTFDNKDFNNNSKPQEKKNEEPVIVKAEFQSRRNNDRGLGKLFEKDSNMIIGDSGYDKKNNILFGMESRRGHNFSNNNKNWVI